MKKQIKIKTQKDFFSKKDIKRIVDNFLKNYKKECKERCMCKVCTY